MFDYLCLPNKADKYHVPCGEEDGDTIVDGVKVKCPGEKVLLDFYFYSIFKFPRL